MKYIWIRRAAIALVLSVPVTHLTAQTGNAPTLPSRPPNLLLLVQQQFRFGSENAREKYEIEITNACRELSVPNQWIDLQSITGAPETLFFDPLDSFALRAAYEKIKADTPWVVYQVNVGRPSPTFFAFVPMSALRQNDDLLTWRGPLRDAEGEASAERMQQIARQAYRSAESNLYAISPRMSHVFKEFADGDPGFWSPVASVDAQHSGNEEANLAVPRRGVETKHYQ